MNPIEEILVKAYDARYETYDEYRQNVYKSFKNHFPNNELTDLKFIGKSLKYDTFLAEIGELKVIFITELDCDICDRYNCYEEQVECCYWDNVPHIKLENFSYKK